MRLRLAATGFALTVVVGDDLDTSFMKRLAEQNDGQTILRGAGLI